ncbi:Rieske (2Fe-2S) protein [Streptomyces sp. NPDC049577]|uniref:Rieske (2Fe-2S) protein n=1 Tax=Streptomyces sp. NPDC049577 TaxID=3155153 RepID=UPI003429BB06
MVTAGVAGLAAVLAACGDSEKKEPKATAQPETASSSGAQQGGSPSGAATSGQAPGGAALARTSEIPVGGGKIFPDRKVVVTQPVKGEFKAFSAVCTHEGCVVGDVSGGTINCPCHGSRFAVADGSVRHGPARRPLPAERISVSGDSVSLG